MAGDRYSENDAETIRHLPARRGRPSNPQRLAAIGDAIVTLLADEGARGLTHRAVDRLAGLPAGTASYHAPTRLDLLVCGSRRLSESGLAELDWLVALTGRHAALTPDQVIEPLLATWRERLRLDRRQRARATIAIELSSSRDPVVSLAYKTPQVFIQIWTQAMTLLGARAPAMAAAEFTGLIRGRFYHHVLSGASLEDDRALRATLEAALRAVIALAPAPDAQAGAGL